MRDGVECVECATCDVVVAVLCGCVGVTGDAVDNGIGMVRDVGIGVVCVIMQGIIYGCVGEVVKEYFAPDVVVRIVEVDVRGGQVWRIGCGVGDVISVLCREGIAIHRLSNNGYHIARVDIGYGHCNGINDRCTVVARLSLGVALPSQ